MTNPNNIVRVRARNGGRASVYEANAWCQSFTAGILEGVGVVQNTSADMNVLVGGSATKPDVLIAQNPSGYKIALDIIGYQAVAITAPTSNSRISAIVAYTDDLSLSTTQSDVTGSPSSCGLIVVNGTAAANPVAPTDTQIREAITQDGATGSQAPYCVIATIKVASNTTMITNSLISTNQAAIGSKNIDCATLYDVLWSNPNPSNTFLAQTINNLDLSKYHFIGIIAKTHTTQTHSNLFIARSQDKSISLSFANNGNTLDRQTTINATSIEFTIARLNSSTDNDRCIPVSILGFYG